MKRLLAFGLLRSALRPKPAGGPTPAGPLTSDEKTSHPIQKPEELLRRIVLASSNVGDVVLDPFVGSGTTAVTAEQPHLPTRNDALRRLVIKALAAERD